MNIFLVRTKTGQEHRKLFLGGLKRLLTNKVLSEVGVCFAHRNDVGPCAMLKDGASPGGHSQFFP